MKQKIKYLWRIFLSLTFFFKSGFSVFSATYIWDSGGGATTTWTTGLNWNPDVVPFFAAGDTMNLSSLNIVAASTSSMDTSNTLQSISIGDMNNTHAWNLGGGGTLSLDGSGAAATITQVATSKGDTISVPTVLLNSNLTLTNSANTNTLTISSGISAGTAGTKTIANSGAGTGNVELSGVVTDGSGVVAITQNSSNSNLVLRNANSYTGSTQVTAGILRVNNANGLGSTASITVSNGAALSLSNNVTVAGKTVTIAGDGTNFYGALQSESGSNTWTGNVILAADNSRIAAEAGTLNVSGAIDDGVNTFGVHVRNRFGSTIFSGANTYNGLTAIVIGSLSASSLNSVSTNAGLGTVQSVSSNLGAPTTVANGKIQLGRPSDGGAATLIYTGSGENTDRTIDLLFTNATSQINQSGTGLLKFLTDLTVTTNGAKTLNFLGSTSGTGEFAGALIDSGAGATAITKLGTGTWALSGTNTYSGATTVTTGTLLFLNTASKSAGTTVTVAAAGTVGLGVGGSGSWTSANIDSLYAGTLTGFTLNAASGVALDTSAGDFTYGSGITANRALTKLGANTLTLTGTNSGTGLLTISNGTAVIGTAAGGSWAGSVIANSGATLKGRGTIGGNVTINSGATYAPGNSPGIQSIVGNLTLASGSRTEIEIDGATAGNGAGFHDQINATGTVMIQGGTIAPMTLFSGSSGYTPASGQRFTAITASSVTGTFATIDNSGNAAGLSFIPEYTNNTVFLRTTFSSFANNSTLPLTPNQNQVAAALDTFRPATIVTGAGATDADRIYGGLTLLNSEGVKNAITQMSPEKLAAMTQVAQSIGTGIHSQVARQLQLRRDFDPAQGDLSIYDRNGQTVYEPVAGLLTDALYFKRKIDKVSFFASVNGEQGEIKPSQQRTDFDYWSATAVYGGNYALSSDLSFGLFTGYGHSDTSLGGVGGKINYDTGKLGGYAAFNHDGWFTHLSLSAGKSFYETRRRIEFLSENATGKTEAWEGVGELRAGKDLSYGKWTLSPSVWGRYSRSFIDSYDEKESSARLHVNSMDQDSVVSGAGIGLQRAIPIATMSIVPRVYLNYEREWARLNTISARFAAGGGTFQTSSDPIDADQLTAGLGTSWVISRDLQIDFSVEAETLQKDLQRHSANLSVKISY